MNFDIPVRRNGRLCFPCPWPGVDLEIPVEELAR